MLAGEDGTLGKSFDHERIALLHALSIKEALIFGSRRVSYTEKEPLKVVRHFEGFRDSRSGQALVVFGFIWAGGSSSSETGLLHTL